MECLCDEDPKGRSRSLSTPSQTRQAHVNFWLISHQQSRMLQAMMGALGTVALYGSSFVLALYVVPQVLLATLCKTQDLKKKYNATWALVTGGSSGRCRTKSPPSSPSLCPIPATPPPTSFPQNTPATGILLSSHPKLHLTFPLPPPPLYPTPAACLPIYFLPSPPLPLLSRPCASGTTKLPLTTRQFNPPPPPTLSRRQTHTRCCT